MEDERFVSGYCRQLDASRMVAVELTDGIITDVDCGFANCPHRPNCSIAKEIEQLQ